MTREEHENALHCLKVMIGEEVCEECNLYGTTGTDHCEADCVRVAIKALEQEPILDKIREEIINPNEMDKLENSNLWQKWFLNLIDKYKAETERGRHDSY